MHVLNNNLIVKEIQTNINVGGIVMKYDDSNPYMFVKLAYDIPTDFAQDLGVESYELPNLVFVIKRVAKIEFLNGCYIVDKKDLVCYMTYQEFEDVVGKV